MIGAHNPGSAITECLKALRDQTGAERIEIIVADSSSDGTPRRVQEFPNVKLLHFDAPLGIPQLRGRGIAAATGPVIAILDPYAIVDSSWSRRLMEAHRQHGNLVIAGSVELHDERRASYLAWVMYVNEYGMFMPPILRGNARVVPGCNVSYKRQALFEDARPRFDVFWKTFVNEDIVLQGSPVWLEQGIGVRLLKPVPFLDFLITRFDHGRCYAGMRSAGRGWPWRILRAVASPILPIVFLWRGGRVYWIKRRYQWLLIATAPLHIVLLAVWTAGEIWGYLRGPGRSCGRLFY